MCVISHLLLLYLLSHWVKLSISLETTANADTNNSFIKAFYNRDRFFVDRSDLLPNVVSFLTKGTYIVTCPHGFGKTTNLRMIEAFYEIHWHANGSVIKDIKAMPSYKYFENSKIFNDKNMMTRQFGKYYVLYLDMDDVDGKIFESQLERIDYCVRKCIAKYKWIVEKISTNTSLRERDKVDAQFYLDAMNDNQTFVNVYSLGLTVTAALLKSYYQAKVMLLVDNYESPLREQLTRGGSDLLENVVNALKLLYKNAFQAHPKYIEYVVYSGISSALAEQISVFIQNYKFLGVHPLWNFCGFQQQDVDLICDTYGIIGKMRENMDKFYGGYFTKKKDAQIYNPVSVKASIANIAKILDVGNVTPVWTKTANSLKLISHCFQRSDINEIMTKLLRDESVFIPYTPTVSRKMTDFFRNMNEEIGNETISGSVDSFFTHLLEIGCLSYNKGTDKFYLPNDEVRNDLKNYFK